MVQAMTLCKVESIKENLTRFKTKDRLKTKGDLIEYIFRLSQATIKLFTILFSPTSQIGKIKAIWIAIEKTNTKRSHILPS